MTDRELADQAVEAALAAEAADQLADQTRRRGNRDTRTQAEKLEAEAEAIATVERLRLS